MKHFMDIENARFEDIDLGNGIIRRKNTGTFEVGDSIRIQTKFDGSNASALYENGTMKAFSRKHELSFNSTLNGFWNYIQNLSPQAVEMFAAYPNFIVFGEWNNKVKIVYDDTGKVKHWYVYDIYDINTQEWQHQEVVKLFCKKAGLEYIHELYSGEFISWDHVKSFSHDTFYGPINEGVICKNQSKLNSPDNRNPFYLKIVNEEFKESMKQKTGKRMSNPEKDAEREHAKSLMSAIVTENRVEKMLQKLVEENILASELTPQDLKIVSQNLPKRIYEDCVKEEPEVVQACGEYASKVCSQLAMQIARNIVLGDKV